MVETTSNPIADLTMVNFLLSGYAREQSNFFQTRSSSLATLQQVQVTQQNQ